MSEKYFSNAKLILKDLCVLATNDSPLYYFKLKLFLRESGAIYSIRSKALFLDLLVQILNDIGPTFSSKKELSVIIKENLCDGLL